jgi:hypothetical protein
MFEAINIGGVDGRSIRRRAMLLTTVAVCAIVVLQSGFFGAVNCLQSKSRSHHADFQASREIKIRGPVAVLHFGNRKTASTALQNILAHIPEYLKQENFVYFGHKQKSYIKGPGRYLHECLATATDCPMTYRQAWTDFVVQLQAYARAGISVIYSDEDIPRLSTASKGRALQAIDDAFSSYTRNRHVTVTYRHYVDWYWSEYNQQHKKRWNNKYVIGVVDWHRADDRREDLIEPLTKRHLEEYQVRFDSVRVFNMHDEQIKETGMFAAWFCQTIPWSPKLCHLARTKQLPLKEIPPAPNPSADDLEARRLAQLVLTNSSTNVSSGEPTTQDDKKHLENLDLNTLKEVTTKISEWLTTQQANLLPWSCLDSKEMDDLWQKTVQTRNDLLPDYDPSNTILQERFDSAILSNRYCQIDYRKLSELESWQSLWGYKQSLVV